MSQVKSDWFVLLKSELASMLQTGRNSDLTIVAGSSREEFKVHRTIISLWSPVMCDKIAELSQSESRIFFPNIDAVALRLYIQFVYTGAFPPHSDTAQNFNRCYALFQVAAYFKFEELADICANSVKTGLSTQNVLNVYEGCFTMRNEGLKLSCLDFIKRNAENILQQPGFKQLPESGLIEIVKAQNLRVKNELTVFNAVYSWAEQGCIGKEKEPKDIREALRDVLKYIRFSQMTHLEFKTHVIPKNILSLEEISSLLVYFMTPANQRQADGNDIFITAPRTYIHEDVD